MYNNVLVSMRLSSLQNMKLLCSMIKRMSCPGSWHNSKHIKIRSIASLQVNWPSCHNMNSSRLVILCVSSNAHRNSGLHCVKLCVPCRTLYASASSFLVCPSGRLLLAQPRLQPANNWRHCSLPWEVNSRFRIAILNRPPCSKRARNHSLNTTGNLQNIVVLSAVGSFLQIPLPKLCTAYILVANVKYKKPTSQLLWKISRTLMYRRALLRLKSVYVSMKLSRPMNVLL